MSELDRDDWTFFSGVGTGIATVGVATLVGGVGSLGFSGGVAVIGAVLFAVAKYKRRRAPLGELA